jgi:hypothetical protein
MNNDASPLLQAHTTDLNDADPSASGDATGGAQSTAQHGSSAGAQQTRRRRRRKTPKADQGLVKKFEFLTHLLKNLDMLVYVELAALYYMEYEDILNESSKASLICFHQMFSSPLLPQRVVSAELPKPQV